MDHVTRKLYRMKADILKAVAHPVRLAIIDAVADGEMCVNDIAKKVQSERSNVSRHLAVMVKGGILSSRKDGLMVYYSLRTPCIVNFFCCVEDVLRAQLHENNAALSRLSRSSSRPAATLQP